MAGNTQHIVLCVTRHSDHCWALEARDCRGRVAAVAVLARAQHVSVHHHIRRTGPRGSAGCANRAVYVSNDWAWPSRNTSFAFCDAPPQPAMGLETPATCMTFLGSPSSSDAGGFWILARDAVHDGRAVGLVRIERIHQNRHVPSRPCHRVSRGGLHKGMSVAASCLTGLSGRPTGGGIDRGHRYDQYLSHELVAKRSL